MGRDGGALRKLVTGRDGWGGGGGGYGNWREADNDLEQMLSETNAKGVTGGEGGNPKI